MRQTLRDRLSMVYDGDDRHALFTSHVWRRLFEVRAPLVREFILEFFSTGLHSEDEMAEAGFGAYWSGSEKVIPDKGDLKDYWMEIIEICPRMNCMSISLVEDRGRQKETKVDLFNLRTMDRGTANVPYLLAKYLFRHAEGRKNGAWLSGGHFIGQLAAHFGLVGDQGLRGLSVVVSELLVIDCTVLGPERQPGCLRLVARHDALASV
ncbi:hypothetical protein Tco_0870005 [Tanacetum coccineum]